MNKALSVIEEQIAKYELLATQKTKKQQEYLEVAEQLRVVVKNCNLQSVSHRTLPDDYKIYECCNCKAINVKKDNGEIRVGFCDECGHPLWN